MWDIRKNLKSVFNYRAHLNDTTYLDWHPEVSGILLSGGTDCKINAWNTKTEENAFTITTANHINKVTWIPEKRYMVSSIQPAL